MTKTYTYDPEAQALEKMRRTSAQEPAEGTETGEATPDYQDGVKLALRGSEEQQITSEDVGGTYKKAEIIPRVSVSTHLADLWDSAYHVARAMLKEFSKKLEDGNGLDQKDVNAYGKVVDGMVKLAREEREQGKLDDPSKWTTEQLVEMVMQAKAAGHLED